MSRVQIPSLAPFSQPAFNMKPLPIHQNQTARSRPLYALAIAVVIGAGLLWRSQLLPLPPFFAKYGGDALWALMVFLASGFMFNRASILRVSLSALCLAWAVEFSQLYHAAWIDSMRATWIGRRVLGAGFNWPDLVAYAVGVAVGTVGECTIRKAL